MDVLIIKSLPRASSQLWKNWKFSRSFPSVRVEHQNYYDILGLQQSCSPADIRRAFIHISKEIHPDMNQGIYSHTSFVALNEAYSVLRKPSSRSFYDARMAAGSIYEVCYDNQKSNSKYAGPNYIQWIAFIVTAFIVIGGSIITISVVGNQIVEHQNHYEVLGLKQSCSSADIRKAFIEKSKKIHPDTNQGKGSHISFVALNEAYTVLSKYSSRSIYDDRLSGRSGRWENIQSTAPKGHVVYKTRNYGFARPATDSDYDSDDFYGIKGVKRQPNHVVALYVVGSGAIITIFLVLFMKLIYDYRKRTLDALHQRTLNDYNQRVGFMSTSRRAMTNRILMERRARMEKSKDTSITVDTG